MVNYRCFRNTDPPLLVEVWNEAFSGRGAVSLQGVNLLERHVLAKPYFDRQGLILAEEDGKPLGFAHAGLSVGKTPAVGVTSLIGVRPLYRRRGIGSELLRRCEAYLRGKGATALQAGAKGAANPFYLGLYGGSDSAGFLCSDQGCQPFLLKNGYQIMEQILVLQRDLTKAIKTVDPRFSGLRQRYESRVRSPRRLDSLAQECEVGQVDPLEFFLEDRQSHTLVARTLAWEMEGFSWRWSRPAFGLINFQVDEPLRRLGLGKYLLISLMRQMQEQYFEIVETHLDESNQPAIDFVNNLGFQQVDVGQVFVRQEN